MACALSVPNTYYSLSYITDLDAYCALALASTASSYQVGYLRDFLHKHLAYRALIAVEVPVRFKINLIACSDSELMVASSQLACPRFL